MDRDRIEGFLERFVELASGATTIGLLAVADRSGLSRHLAATGGGTAAEMAAGAGLQERYVREILAGLAAAGVVEYEAANERFSLPPEHGLFVADESSPYFMGGWFDMIPLVMRHIDSVAEAAVTGGGVPFEEFGAEFVAAIDRGNGPSQRVFLTRRWLPAVPGLESRLKNGIRVADVGCGSGMAVFLMAEAYPASTVHGFDPSETSIVRARERIGHLDNAELTVCGVEDLPNDPGFDLITTFDVVHDLLDPLTGLRRIREAIRPGGVYLMMEPAASSRIEENMDDQGALLYGISTLHCMTQSLARGGAGLGAAWGEQKAGELAVEAGFASFTRLDAISNRFSTFYLLEP